MESYLNTFDTNNIDEWVDVSIEDAVEVFEGNVHISKDSRKQIIADFYFGRQYTLYEVAEEIGISKSQVWREVEEIRNEMLHHIRKDIRLNKRVLGFMVDLMAGIYSQQRIVWEKYNELEDGLSIYRDELNSLCAEEHGGFNITKLTELIGCINNIHNTQQGYLIIARQLTLTTLQIWDRFGLCDNEAFEIMSASKEDIKTKIEEVKRILSNLIDIIKEEVNDEQIRKNILYRLTQEIKIDDIC